MTTHQETLEFRTPGRGLTEITPDVQQLVARAKISDGLVHVFCQHTSASLVIMENADPTAQTDLEAFFERLAPDADPRYRHDAEGPDDMAAHLRMCLTRTGETLPVRRGRLALGTWQGLFLWEHRTHPYLRHLVITVQGD